MNAEKNPWKFIIIFSLRYFIALTIVLYLVRLGVTVLVGVKTGIFNFDLHDDFFASLKDGLFWGGIFGIAE